jgi:hypothetical protein
MFNTLSRLIRSPDMVVEMMGKMSCRRNMAIASTVFRSYQREKVDRRGYRFLFSVDRRGGGAMPGINFDELLEFIDSCRWQTWQNDRDQPAWWQTVERPEQKFDPLNVVALSINEAGLVLATHEVRKSADGSPSFSELMTEEPADGAEPEHAGSLSHRFTGVASIGPSDFSSFGSGARALSALSMTQVQQEQDGGRFNVLTRPEIRIMIRRISFDTGA